MPGSGYTNIGPIDGEFTEVIINQTNAATVALVSGVSGQKTRAYRFFVSASANTATVQFLDGTTALTGAMTLNNSGLSVSFDGNPYFTTSSGNALNMIVGGAGTVGGRLYYKQG